MSQAQTPVHAETAPASDATAGNGQATTTGNGQATTTGNGQATVPARVGLRTRILGPPESEPQSPKRSSMWSQLRPLLGHRRGSIAALAIASIFSGFAEAGVLAIVAQVAT